MKYFVKAAIVYLVAMLIIMLVNELTVLALPVLHLSLCGLFMYGTSVAVHHFTIVASKERAELFPTYFMAITGMKMFVYILALGLYVFIFKDSATPVIITFLVFYVVYSILEVVTALNILKS